MNATIPFLAVLAVVASTWTRINAVVLGQPVSVPLIGVIALAVVLALVIALLWVLRTLIRDGLRLVPAWTGGPA